MPCSAAEERGRNGDTKLPRCLEVDEQFDFRDLLDRQIRRFLTLEYASGLDASLTVRFQKTAGVTHQPPFDSEVARLMDRRHHVPDSEGRELLTVRAEEGIGGYH